MKRATDRIPRPSYGSARWGRRMPTLLLAALLTLLMPAGLWAGSGQSDAGKPRLGADEAVRRQVRELMERNGLREQILAWRPWMTQNAESLRGNEELPQRNREIAAQVLERMFEPQAVIERVEDHLAAIWSQQDSATVLAFLDAGVGRRMTELEVTSGDIATQEDERAWKAGLAETPPPEERIALIVELDRTAWVSRTAVETWTIMSTASALAVAAAGPRDVSIGPEQVRQVREAVREKIAEPVRQEVLLSMLYTYRDATAEELRAYIDFHETPAGQWYRQVMSAAMLRALSDTANEAGSQIQHQVAL